MAQNQEKIYLEQFIRSMPGSREGIDCIGLQKTDKAYLISRLFQHYHEPMVVIVASSKEGRRVCDELRFFLGSEAAVVQYFPPYNLLPYKFLTSDSETAANRIRVLYNLVNQGVPSIIVTTIDGLMKKTLPRASLCGYAELVMAGEEIDREALIEKLEAGGYERAAIVEEPGDYCVRGGILDIYSPLYPQPLRMELFADLVESLRFYSPVSQRTIRQVQEAVLLPAKEVILDRRHLPGLIGRIRKEASRLNTPVTTVRKMIERLKNEGVSSGSDHLMALIDSDLETLFDYSGGQTCFVVTDYEQVKAEAEAFENHVQKQFETVLADGGFAVSPEKTFLDWGAVQSGFSRSRTLMFKAISMIDHGGQAMPNASQYHFQVHDNTELIEALRHPQSLEAPLSPLVNWIDEHQQRGDLTVIVCAFSSQAERLKSMLLAYPIQVLSRETFPSRPAPNDLQKKPVYLCVGEISSGFVWPEAAIALITANEIFGTRRKGTAAGRSRVQKQLLRFEDLKIGDLVVHDEHGIGQYKGLIKLTVEFATNDYLLIMYRDDDRLYLPVDRMNRIQKYMGVDGVVPVVDKMGGKAWDRMKTKAKKSTVKIAKELLRIYATRKVHQGFSHRAVERELQDFENGFPYEETADQLKVIETVLHDMGESVPMDRLVCGDVGYGKTEVALRAAFVSVYNGKQVAVLVPTTVLAEQHFATFSERFKDYPVNIACLSRFRSRPEQRKIVNDVKEGKIDIVVGTHRLTPERCCLQRSRAVRYR